MDGWSRGVARVEEIAAAGASLPASAIAATGAPEA